MFCRSLDGFHRLNGNVFLKWFPGENTPTSPVPTASSSSCAWPTGGSDLLLDLWLCRWSKCICLQEPNWMMAKPLVMSNENSSIVPICEFEWQSWYQMGPFQWLERQMINLTMRFLIKFPMPSFQTNHLAPQLIHHPAARHGDRYPQLNPAIGGPWGCTTLSGEGSRWYPNAPFFAGICTKTISYLVVSTRLKNISQNGNLPQFSGWK